jgi:hypothetical protein
MQTPWRKRVNAFGLPLRAPERVPERVAWEGMGGQNCSRVSSLEAEHSGRFYTVGGHI